MFQIDRESVKRVRLAKIRQKAAAVVAAFNAFGISLPDDTSEQPVPIILDRILTGLMTKRGMAENARRERTRRQIAAGHFDDNPANLQFSVADGAGPLLVPDDQIKHETIGRRAAEAAVDQLARKIPGIILGRDLPPGKGGK